ncbi:hypothetical protein ACLMJK_002103 [Lecanora helva]
MFNLNTPLRLFQAALALATLGLSGYITHWYLHHTSPAAVPISTIYLLTVSSLTLLLTPYLLLNPALSLRHHNNPTPPGRFFNKHLILTLDTLLALLWFAGFVALAVFEHGLHICAGHVCDVMIGGVVCGALGMGSFFVTAGLAGAHVLRTRGGDMEVRGNHERWVGQMEARKVDA